MPVELRTKDERHVLRMRPAADAAGEEEAPAAARRQARRVRRLKVNAVAWFLGSALITVLWALSQRHANGPFEHFGSHQGNPGDWNPTLWALGVGIWGLIVGIMALRVYFERPPSDALGRLRFHVAAWVLGVVVLTPLWALVEWQDNGGFRRWSGNGRPGSWEPSILYVGGIWAAAIVLLALWMHFGPAVRAKLEAGLLALRVRSRGER